MVVALASGSGCLGEDEGVESGDSVAADQEQDSALRRHRVDRRKPGTAGAPGTDAGLSGEGCEICARAEACCEAVRAANGSNMLCLFTGPTCSGRPEATQGCKTFLAVVISTWGGNPPAACLAP
jgi:hypothetical protein